MTYNTTGGDFAEYLPKRDGSETMMPGDVVGVFRGQLSRNTAGADRVLAVSTAPAFLGNTPAEEILRALEALYQVPPFP